MDYLSPAPLVLSLSLLLAGAGFLSACWARPPTPRGALGWRHPPLSARHAALPAVRAALTPRISPSADNRLTN